MNYGCNLYLNKTRYFLEKMKSIAGEFRSEYGSIPDLNLYDVKRVLKEK